MFELDLDVANVLQRAIKYLVEGLAVAVAAYYIPRKKMNPKEIAVIALTAAASLAVLDLLAPAVGLGARHGVVAASRWRVVHGSSGAGHRN